MAIGLVAIISVAMLVFFAAAIGGVAAAIVIDAARVKAASALESKLNVCADPDNLPFSNVRQQGFENAIAGLLADELGRSVQYYWRPHSLTFIRHTLLANQCDVVMGVPTSFEGVALTRPYYRMPGTFPRDRRLQINLVDDPAARMLLSLPFEMAIAVRCDDIRLRDQLDAAIARRSNDVRRILTRFGVPFVEFEGQTLDHGTRNAPSEK